MHLAIRIKGQYLTLAPDTSIDIEDTNPYFNDVSETFSFPFSVPVEGNRAIFGNIDTIESDANVHASDGDVMTIEVDGVPIRSGKVGNIEDQEITDTISMQMVSSVYSLDDYLDGVRCRDVPQRDRIVIGETIGNLTAFYSYIFELKANLNLIPYYTGQGFQGTNVPYALTSDTFSATEQLSVQLPALGFSRPDSCIIKPGTFGGHDSDGSIGIEPTIRESYVNVSDEYPKQMYCNARICYMHYKKDDDGTSSDEVDTSTTDTSAEGKFNPYLVLDANRPASGICFYLLYFLDCLFYNFRNDGIVYDNSELLKVSDLKRLAFFTTHCKYDLEKLDPYSAPGDLGSIEMINRWLHSRNIDTTLSIPDISARKDLDSVTVNGRELKKGDVLKPAPPEFEEIASSAVINSVYSEVTLKSSGAKADIMQMVANSQNFPDADAKEIIDSLWGSFGIKFYLDQETRVVKPIFIRDIFRSTDPAIDFDCTVYTAIRKTEKITGFRMQYSQQSDRQQREDNITLGVRDYDTTYDYQDYRNLDDSQHYDTIITQAFDTNMTFYVDLLTGNKYRVKVDSEAESDTEGTISERRDKFHPVIFEVGQLTGVEIGDCSKQNEDYITEVTSAFQPVILNDVNYRYERKAMAEEVMMGESGNTVLLRTEASKQQILSAFISEEMWHENIKRTLVYPMGSKHVELAIQADITTKESYDVQSSNDGDSPLQSIDWGLAVSMMRGGGATSHIDYYDYDYDGFGNCKYRITAGNDYTMSLDSIDDYGKPYDYNGDADGIGSTADERFSLKIRSYANHPVTGEPMVIPDRAIANRGLFDTFFSEYAYFLLNRKIVVIDLDCEVASLLNIQWTRRYRFGDYVGWINKISTHISAENGIESVRIELFVL